MELNVQVEHVHLTCPTGELSPSGDSIIYDYEIKVTNTGFGALYDLDIEDITAGESFTADVLIAGETATFTGSFVSLINGVENEASVSATIKDGGEPVLTKSDTDSCPPINSVGALSITKECTAYVEENASGEYGLRVNYEGKVCNDSKVKLNEVNITEMHDGITAIKNVGTLAPESCMNYDGSYIPSPGSDVSGGPVVAHDVRTFKDTVKAEGVNVITGDTVDTGVPVEASCPLCPAP